MQLITDEHRTTMLANGRHYEIEPGFDPCPVVKIFNPLGAATWLLCALERDDPDIAFGLCDLGFGSPEVGSVRISEMEAIVLPFGLCLERDLHFRADKPLSHYTEDARARSDSRMRCDIQRILWRHRIVTVWIN